MMQLTMGSLFDGIGGFPLAAERCGITPVWASEIEPFPIEVTRTHFPNMLHVGDVTKLDGARLPPVDIICGGSPCQDLSVAGARAGLAGERSGLFMEQIRIVKEMRNAEKRRGRTGVAVRPRFCVWENVPGAFSSAEGRDFHAVLEEFVHVEEPQLHVVRPESGRWEYAGAVLGVRSCVAWTTWDAQYFGVPQRRRRIFLVADFAGFSPVQILFDPTGLPGYPARAEERNKPLPPMLEWALRVQAGLTPTQPIPILAPVAGFLAESSATAGSVGYEEELAPTMKAGGKSGAVMLPAAGFAEYSNQLGLIGYQEEIAATLKAGGIKPQVMLPTLCLNDQGGGRMDCGEEQSGTLRAQTHGHEPLVFANHGQGTRFTGPIDTSTTVTAGYGEGGNNTPFVFENHGIDARYTGPHEVSPTMSARYGTGGNNVPLVGEVEVYCITGNAIGREPQNGGNGLGIDEDVSHTLTATDRHAVFSRQRTDVFKPDEIASTESARQHKDATDLVYDEAEVEVLDLPLLIRRLMPIECERLQGFPDGRTDIPGASDAARYKALGNSVAIPCVQLLMLGISLVLRNGGEHYATVIELSNMLLEVS